MSAKLTVADYPLAEKRPELVKGRGGKPLDAITLDAVTAGRGDPRRPPDHPGGAPSGRPRYPATRAARHLPRISSGRPSSATCPRTSSWRSTSCSGPGRAKDKGPLLEAARTLRETYGATRMAAFVEEAAAVYERRGLFTYGSDGDLSDANFSRQLHTCHPRRARRSRQGRASSKHCAIPHDFPTSFTGPPLARG